jgi:hypothetical protein
MAKVTARFPKNCSRVTIASSSRTDKAKCYEETHMILHFGNVEVNEDEIVCTEDQVTLNSFYASYERFSAVSRGQLVHTLRGWILPHLDHANGNIPKITKKSLDAALGKVYDDPEDWDEALASAMHNAGYSQYRVGYEGCGHTYPVKQGHWKEDEVKAICEETGDDHTAYYPYGCMICAKYNIQRGVFSHHLALLMRFAGFVTQNSKTEMASEEVAELPNSDLKISAILLFMHFLYSEKNILTKEEWKGLRYGKISVEDILQERGCAFHHIFWPNFEKEHYCFPA